MKAVYSTLDVVKILGIPRERLREWLSRGFVTPGIQEASGAGTKALFKPEDLYRIMLFKQLVESGVSRETASQVLSRFSSQEISSAGLAAAGYENGRFAADMALDLTDEELKTLAGEVKSELGAEDLLRLVPRWLRERYGHSLMKASSLFAAKVKKRLLLKLMGDRDYVLVINTKKARDEVGQLVKNS
jgi:DNA-binding transcriptional MerR regulator